MEAFKHNVSFLRDSMKRLDNAVESNNVKRMVISARRCSEAMYAVSAQAILLDMLYD